MKEIIKQHNSSNLVNIKKFASMTGETEGVVRGWCNRGYIPTIKIGKRLLINVQEILIRSK